MCLGWLMVLFPVSAFVQFSNARARKRTLPSAPDEARRAHTSSIGSPTAGSPSWPRKKKVKLKLLLLQAGILESWGKAASPFLGRFWL